MIFNCIYVSIFFTLYIWEKSEFNTHIYIHIYWYWWYKCIAVNKRVSLEPELCVCASLCVFPFLEMLEQRGVLTFSRCKRGITWPSDHRGHVGLCGPSAISEPKRTIIPQQLLPPSARTASFSLSHVTWTGLCSMVDTSLPQKNKEGTASVRWIRKYKWIFYFVFAITLILFTLIFSEQQSTI